MEHSLHNKIKIVQVVAPADAAVTATAVGAIVDTQGFESLEYVANAENLNGEFTFLLEESDDSGLSGSNVVSSDETLGALPVMDTGRDIGRVGVIGKKRYQRLTLTESGANTVGTIGAIAILGHPKNAPTDEQAD